MTAFLAGLFSVESSKRGKRILKENILSLQQQFAFMNRFLKICLSLIPGLRLQAGFDPDDVRLRRAGLLDVHRRQVFHPDVFHQQVFRCK